MGSGWCWVAGAVFASLLCGVCGQEAAIDVNVPFPNELLGEHIALIAVPLLVTGAAICCAVVIACARTLKLTVVLVLGVWLALLSVGIVSWYVTYNTSRDLLIERASQTLSVTAQQARASVLSEIGTGVDAMLQVQSLTKQGMLDVFASWPVPQSSLHSILLPLAGRTSSISMLMLVSAEGDFHGIHPREFLIDSVYVDTHFTRVFPYGDLNVLPPWAACRPTNWGARNCTVEATPAACANESSYASTHCTAACGFPAMSRMNCRGQALGFQTIARGSNVSAASDVARVAGFEAGPRLRVFHVSGDLRKQPWYHTNPEPRFTFLYQLDGKASLAVSAGLRSLSGAVLGCTSVNLRLDLLSQFLRRLRPTDGSVVFLVATDLSLAGSSFTPLELMEDSGMQRPNTFEIANVKNYNNSESRILKGLRAVRSQWGTVAGATTHSALFPFEGDFTVTYPVHLSQLGMVLVISVPVVDVMGDADRASTISLVMTVCISVGLALLVAGGLKVALLPLDQLQHDMNSVACMRLEDHDESSLSRLSEVRSMQESFRVMVANLIEYKQYLPQSVLQDTSDGEGSLTSESRISRMLKMSKSSKNTVKDSEESLPDVPARFTDLSNPCRMRYVSLVVTNLSGFVQLSKAVSNQDLLELHASYLNVLVGMAKAGRGMIDEFIGDKVHVSFNSLFNCSGHRSAAASFLLEATGHQFGERRSQIQVNAAAVSMKAVCGNFGCKGLKKYTIVGASGARVWNFERWGKAWDVKALADEFIAQELHVSFSLRRIAKMRSSDTQEGFLYEVMGEKRVKQGEWMYEIEDSMANNPLSACNDAVDLLYKGKFDEARDTLNQYASDSSPHISPLLQWVSECQRSNTPPDPLPAVLVPDAKRAFSTDDYKLLPGFRA